MSAPSISDTGSGHPFARGLLDAATPADESAHEAIDDALRRRSTNAELHAAALLLAANGGGDLRLSRSHARGWIPGLHELIDSGHVEAAQAVVPALRAAFPQSPFLEFIQIVFRDLPPVVDNGREPFTDDRSRDVQVVTCPGADTLVMVFCGARHQLGVATNLVDRWFAALGCHVAYLRDRQKIGYTGGIEALGPDMPATLEALSKLIIDLDPRRVVSLGNSAGAAGALRYAAPLGVDRVLALAPITGGAEYTKKLAPHLPPGGVAWWGDLVPLLRREPGVRAHLMYGARNAGDRQQALRMAGLPGITVESLPDWESHHLISGLIRAGRLTEMLNWLTADDDNRLTDRSPAPAPLPDAGGQRGDVTH